MPHPTDETDANALPDPELNPLLNPLLAAHMGRWAEVYFTAPPEKRGQAVSELLQELKNDSPPEAASVPVISSNESVGESASVSETPESGSEKNESKEELNSSPELAAAATAAAAFHTCSLCGHNNAMGQRFCGMCGALLQVSPGADSSQLVEAAPGSAAHSSEQEPSSSEGNFPEQAIAPTFSSDTIDGNGATESAWSLPERSIPHFAMEPVPAPHRYRLYGGIVLAILLVLLVYMSWRGTQAISGAAGTRSAASKTIPPAPTAAEPRTAPPEVTAASAQPSVSGNASPDATPPAYPPRTAHPPVARSRKTPATRTRSKSQIVTMAASSSALAADAGGAEELGSAERYLNSTPRDSREAALWLWKAVGKGNLTATMALSDLYLRGDGVPKSCDQAHLLLDAAARKGGKAAAERLRNLQAFGCN